VVGETVRVLEDAAADHEAVDLGVFGVECEGVGFVFDVAIDDKLGVGADLAAKFDNIGDEFVVGGGFGHFFLSTEVDGEGGG